jgi:hemolysin activation/secretion protein
MAWGQTLPVDNAAQELLRQQDRQRVLRQRQENTPEVRLQQPVTAQQERLPQNEAPCFRINNIILTGDAAERFQWALGAANPGEDPAIGQCLGAEGISLSAKRVQNAIIARGYVTTRVLVTPQDIKAGTLTLTLIPGRISAIRFTSESNARATQWNAVPAAPGDILNLRDIEQALENFKRVPTAEADIQITPVEGQDVKPGQSDLVIAWKQGRPLRLNFSADDSGSQYTGKYQGSATLSWDDPLTLNDLLYVSLNHDLVAGNGQGRGTHGYTVHYEVPWGYWLLGLTASGYDYHQSVAGATQTYNYAGASGNQEIALTRVVQRDARGKTTVSAKAWRKSSNNYIDDTEVLVQRRVEGGWELGAGRNQSWGNTTLDAKIAYKKGTGAFGALVAPEDAFGEGSAHFRLITADLTLNAPFQWGGQKLRYVGQWRGQWSGAPLVPIDRFGIGGRYTVRGFDGQLQLLAERGWLWRNELALSLGQSGQEIYAGIDHGQVGGPSAQDLVGTALTGAVLGWRGALAKLQYDLFIGAPIAKPRFFKTAPWTAGFSLNWSI